MTTSFVCGAINIHILQELEPYPKCTIGNCSLKLNITVQSGTGSVISTSAGPIVGGTLSTGTIYPIIPSNFPVCVCGDAYCTQSQYRMRMPYQKISPNWFKNNTFDKGFEVDKVGQLKKEKTMGYDEPDEIPAKLSLMETMFADDDTKVLTKARFMYGGELTNAGKKALDLITFKTNKEALVELAKTLLDEAAAEKK